MWGTEAPRYLTPVFTGMTRQVVRGQVRSFLHGQTEFVHGTLLLVGLEYKGGAGFKSVPRFSCTFFVFFLFTVCFAVVMVIVLIVIVAVFSDIDIIED